MKMPTNVAKLATICAAAGALATVADAQPTTRSVVEQRVDASGLYAKIPLQTWSVDVKSFIDHAARTARSKGGATKAATDRATVYRPIAVCRLIDTRGLAAAIAVAGPIGPGIKGQGTSTFINSAGACGIPNNGKVAGISLSFHIWNHTTTNGGYISFLQQDVSTVPTPPTVNAVFNDVPGTVWTAGTANVSIPDDSGNFKIFIANSSVDVIVDVNGYYQDLDNLDVGSQELNISGTTAGTLFELDNLGTGSALAASTFGGGPAFTIFSGYMRANGAGIGTPTVAFIHRVTAASLCGGDNTYSVIDNLLLNADPGAIAVVAPRFNPTSDPSAVQPSTATPAIEYRLTNTCSNSIPGARWFLHTPGTSLVTDSYYNVIVIKP
ncbi:MAG TPA: hypothetical protein VL693_03515 [Vicinamibacterales bacterium]|nr:hypothetical protein [Vicinamibacterales bacterium]